MSAGDAPAERPSPTAGSAPDLRAPAEVIIPTLREPVRLVALLEERGEARSMVTLASSSVTAGIGSLYTAFVEHSTGVIHRLFPKPVPTYYRVEVDQPVEAGHSFELPMLVAHALHEERRLVAIGSPGAPPEGGPAPPLLVWATGKIAPLTYEIGMVTDVSMKLKASYKLFEQALARGQTVKLFAPAGYANDLEPEVANWLREHGLEVRYARWADEVFEALSLRPIPRASSLGKEADGWTGNPYRGLDPFENEHRRVFFGRGRPREETLEQLRSAAAQGVPFLLVHGQSGAGKSSLVRAGLAGDVIARAEEGGSFHTAIVTPGMGNGRPALALLRGLLELAGKTLPAEPLADEGLPDAFATALSELEEHHAAGPERQTGLMILDQLEETFDPGIPADAAARFAAELDRIVRSGAVWVIATMRSDAIGGLDRLPEIAQLASKERVFRLDRPSPYELAEIIAAPAALAGKPFLDQRVVEDLAGAAARSPDSLPLLQTLLQGFFDAAGPAAFDRASLKRFGRFEDAVGRWAEGIRAELVRQVPPLLLDRALVSLIRIDPETNRPMARSVPLDPGSEAGEVLGLLVSRRLATAFDGVDGAQVRLAHEALVTHWPHLAELAQRLAQEIAFRDQLDGDAARWLRGGRDAGDLLHSRSRLDDAEAFIDRALVAPQVEEVADFIAGSRQALQAAEAEALRSASIEQGRARLAGMVRLLSAAGVVLLAAGAAFSLYFWMDGVVSNAGRLLEASDTVVARRTIEPVLTNPLLRVLPATSSLEALSTRFIDTPMVAPVSQDSLPPTVKWDYRVTAPSLIPSSSGGIAGCDLTRVHCLTFQEDSLYQLRYGLVVKRPDGDFDRFEDFFVAPEELGMAIMDPAGSWLAIADEDRLSIWWLDGVSEARREPLHELRLPAKVTALSFSEVDPVLFAETKQGFFRVDLEPRFAPAREDERDGIAKRVRDATAPVPGAVEATSLRDQFGTLLSDPEIGPLISQVSEGQDGPPLPLHLFPDGRVIFGFRDTECERTESLLLVDPHGSSSSNGLMALKIPCAFEAGVFFGGAAFAQAGHKVHIGATYIHGYLEWTGGYDLVGYWFTRPADGSALTVRVPLEAVKQDGLSIRTVGDLTQPDGLTWYDPISVRAFATPASGQLIAVYGDSNYRATDRQGYVIDTGTGQMAEIPQTFASQKDFLETMTFSPDGRFLLTTKSEGGMQLFSAPDMQRLPLPQGMAGAVFETDDLLAVTLKSGAVGRWHLPENVGQQVAWLRNRFDEQASRGSPLPAADYQLPMASAAEITRLEVGLSLLGYFEGPADGTYTDALRDAVARFASDGQYDLSRASVRVTLLAMDHALKGSAEIRTVVGNVVIAEANQLQIDDQLIPRAELALISRGLLRRHAPSRDDVASAIFNYRRYYHPERSGPVTRAEIDEITDTSMLADDRLSVAMANLVDTSFDMIVTINSNLHRMGLYSGTLDDVGDPAMTAAIVEFETQANLEVTGAATEVNAVLMIYKERY